MCTTQITAKGAVPRDAIATAIDGSVPMLDQQCLAASQRRGRNSNTSGTMTYTFVIREGVPGNRRLERQSSNSSLDECVLRGLGDVRFLSSPEETEVSVSFAFDARRPSN
jgi:hypothetical protein